MSRAFSAQARLGPGAYDESQSAPRPPILVEFSLVKRNALIIVLFSLAACAHKPPLSQMPGLPPIEEVNAEQPEPGAAAAPPAAAAEVPNGNGVAIDTAAVTEQEIREAEEVEGGVGVIISSAPPPPPPARNLGGNGKLTVTRYDNREKVTVVYRDKKGVYDEKALKKLNHVMRCSLDNSEAEMAVLLIELLDSVEDKFGGKGIVLLSGYRTLELNRMTKGAAEHSMHMLGWAADIRVPGYSSTKVKTFARKKGVGGVGYYPQMGFTHLDVGKVRYWAVKKIAKKRRAVRHAPARHKAKKAVRQPARKPAKKKK